MNERNEHLRRCTGCGGMFPKKNMIRVVRAKNGMFFPDSTGKVNGRGAYVCRNVDCIEKAVKCRGFEKSFKTDLPESLYDDLKKLIQGGESF